MDTSFVWEGEAVMARSKTLRHVVATVFLLGLLVVLPPTPASAAECDVSVLVWGHTSTFLIFTTGYEGFATGILNCYENRKVAGVIVTKVKVLPEGADSNSRKCDDFVWCQADTDAAGPQGGVAGNCVVGEADGAVIGGVNDRKNGLTDWDYVCTEILSGVG